MREELLLRPGVSVNTVLVTLNDLTARVKNAVSRSGLGGLLTDYLTWVENAEFQLRGLFASPSVWQELYSERYWHLRDLAQGRAIRGVPLIANEGAWQGDRLQAIRDQLQEAQQLFDLPREYVAIVPDTDVFVEHKRYDQIDWPKLAGAKKVRLVVPLLVIDQLDDLSYKARPSARERARAVIKDLRKRRGEEAPESPVVVRRDVDLQLLVDPPSHKRRTNEDDEILTRVEYLTALVEGRVAVATGDYGMQLRASARGLRSLALPGVLRLTDSNRKSEA